MDAINLMMDEHKNILRGLKLFRKLSLEVLKGNSIDFVAFEKMISFVDTLEELERKYEIWVFIKN